MSEAQLEQYGERKPNKTGDDRCTICSHPPHSKRLNHQDQIEPVNTPIGETEIPYVWREIGCPDDSMNELHRHDQHPNGNDSEQEHRSKSQLCISTSPTCRGRLASASSGSAIAPDAAKETPCKPSGSISGRTRWPMVGNRGRNPSYGYGTYAGLSWFRSARRKGQM
jgi:hypothetical protein